MATEGKIPMLGFKAAAIKFVTLLGFSPNNVVVTAPGLAYLSDESTARASVFDSRMGIATLSDAIVGQSEVTDGGS